MTTQIQRRRGTTAQHSTFTGAVGEVTVDTDKEVLVVHDGAQVGGYPQMRENGSNSALALGSAGTPSLKFSGDPNTGIYSPGADQVAISTGGSGRLFVDASGNIGVATSSPGTRLHVNDGFIRTSRYGAAGVVQLDRAQGTAASPTAISSSAGMGAIQARGFDGSNYQVGGALFFITDGAVSSTSSPAAFTVETTPSGSTTSQERLRITSDGKLGLGTSSPSDTLHVNGTSQITGLARFNNGIQLKAATQNYIYFDDALSLTRSGVGDRLTIDSSGRVGIGTASAAVNLEVRKDENSQTTIKITNANTGSAAASILQLQSGTASDVVNFAASKSGAYLAVQGYNSINTIYSDFTAHIWRNQAGTTEYGRFDSSGRLGIGTSSPSSKLYVSETNATSPSLTYGAASSFTFLGANVELAGGLSGTTPFPYWLQTRDSTNAARTLAINPLGGNVGIGTTSPDYKLDILPDSAGATLRVRGGSSGAGIIQFTDNVASAQWGTLSATSGSLDVGHSSVVRFYTSSSERARLTGSGQWLVGTSSYSGSGTGFEIEGTGSFGPQIINSAKGSDIYPPFFILQKARGTSIVQNNDFLGDVQYKGYDGSAYIAAATIRCDVDGTPGANNMPGRIVLSTTPNSSSSPVERLRIDNAGLISTFGATNGFSVGSASAAGTTNVFIVGAHSRTGTTTGGTTSFVVYTNGNVQNTNNSYGAISDIKLKENIVDATSQWNDLKALQVRKYNFKEGQTHTQIGLVAQEVELVSPGLVSESPDRDEEGNDLGTVTKSVNYSVLYMKAVKALQEAMERIETLEAKMAALESA